MNDYLKHGVIESLEAALAAAKTAESEDLRGMYPAAAIVLAREVHLLNVQLEECRRIRNGFIESLAKTAGYAKA